MEAIFFYQIQTRNTLLDGVTLNPDGTLVFHTLTLDKQFPDHIKGVGLDPSIILVTWFDNPNLYHTKTIRILSWIRNYLLFSKYDEQPHIALSKLANTEIPNLTQVWGMDQPSIRDVLTRFV